MLDPNRLQLVPLPSPLPERLDLATPTHVLEWPKNSPELIRIRIENVKRQLADESETRAVDIVSKDGDRILRVTHIWKTNDGRIFERESSESTRVGKFTMNRLSDQPESALLSGALGYMRDETNVLALDYFIVADNVTELVFKLRRRTTGEVDVIRQSSLPPDSAHINESRVSSIR